VIEIGESLPFFHVASWSWRFFFFSDFFSLIFFLGEKVMALLKRWHGVFGGGYTPVFVVGGNWMPRFVCWWDGAWSMV